jgi:hypothetical protein
MNHYASLTKAKAAALCFAFAASLYLSDRTSLLASVAAFFAAVLSLQLLHQHVRLPGEPPLYGGWMPFMGHGVEFGTNARGLLERLRDAAAPSPWFTLYVAGQRMTFVADVHGIAPVLKERKFLAFEPVGKHIKRSLAVVNESVRNSAKGGSEAMHRANTPHVTPRHALFRDVLWCKVVGRRWLGHPLLSHGPPPSSVLHTPPQSVTCHLTCPLWSHGRPFLPGHRLCLGTWRASESAS